MSPTTKLRLTIVLKHGTFVNVYLLASGWPQIKENLIRGCKAQDQWLMAAWDACECGTAVYLPEVAGWYLSVVETPAAERAAAAIEKLADSETRGEEWKE